MAPVPVVTQVPPLRQTLALLAHTFVSKFNPGNYFKMKKRSVNVQEKHLMFYTIYTLFYLQQF